MKVLLITHILIILTLSISMFYKTYLLAIRAEGKFDTIHKKTSIWIKILFIVALLTGSFMFYKFWGGVWVNWFVIKIALLVFSIISAIIGESKKNLTLLLMACIGYLLIIFVSFTKVPLI